MSFVHRISFLFVCGMIGLGVVSPGLKAQPLPPPTTHVIYSPHRRYFAQSNPFTWTTTVYRVTRKGQPSQQLWQMKNYLRFFQLSDDGQHIVAYNDVFLLSEDVRPDMWVLWFYNRDQLTRAYTLGDFGLNEQNMSQTSEGYPWGDIGRIDILGHLQVSTSIRIYSFDVSTGTIVTMVDITPKK